jgi:hypothetical protein
MSYRRATRPLNSEAIRAANAAIAAETGGRPLTMGPEDAALRRKWMDAYIAAGGNSETVAPGGQTPANPTQPCPQSCTITSRTVATSPANRARTRVGVGEEVELTVSPGPATWSVSGGGTLSSTSGTTVTFTARDRAATSTITATGSGCSCTITFTIVEPSSFTMKKQSSTNLKHTNGHPDCGWKGIAYVHPNDVNFYRVETREVDSLSVATGSYNPSHHGKYHGSYPPPDRVSAWFPIVSHSDADGSTDNAPDEIYSGYPSSTVTGTAPPFSVGSYYWPITWQWRVGTGVAHDFPAVRQEHEIFSDGKCESRKAGHTERTMPNDLTSNY